MYSTASITDCEKKFIAGKCYSEEYAKILEVIIGWYYNPDLEIDPTTNVYVREEKVWFLDTRGDLIPAKVVIQVW